MRLGFKLIALMPFCALAGCGDYCPADKLKIGMLKADVVRLCGQPSSTWDDAPGSHTLTSEGLDIQSDDHKWFYHHGVFPKYSLDYVSIRDGKVDYANSEP